MRLADQSRAQLERFLQSHLRDETVRLPGVFIHAGFFSRRITQLFHIAAITFGTHIFVAPELIERDSRGRVCLPGWLLAHEVAHVRQYAEEGLSPFLFNYVREYVGALRKSKRIDAKARAEAYEQITHERKARAVETAYLVWRAGAAWPDDAAARESEEAGVM